MDTRRAAGLPGVALQGTALRLTNVCLTLPDGRVLLEPANATVEAGDRVAVIGAAGAGMTTLFRAIAGIWPFGRIT